MKLKIKELKKKIKNLPKENLFDFTEYFKKQKEDDEGDLGFFLELAEENIILYNQTPVNTPIEDMGSLKNGFFTSGFFSLADVGEIDTNRFFKVSNEVYRFVDKKLDKYDDFSSIYYTGNLYRYFRKIERVNRSERGRSANEFFNIQEYKGINCYIPSGNGCFLKCINSFFRKDFSIEYFEFIQSYKRRINVMTRCRIPEFCGRYKIDIRIYDPKSKRILPWNVEQKDIYVHSKKKSILCSLGEKLKGFFT